MFGVAARLRMYWPNVLVLSPGMVTISRPLGEAEATSQVRIGLVNFGLLHGPSQSGQP